MGEVSLHLGPRHRVLVFPLLDEHAVVRVFAEFVALLDVDLNSLHSNTFKAVADANGLE
jgi:hypothetical protein